MRDVYVVFDMRPRWAPVKGEVRVSHNSEMRSSPATGKLASSGTGVQLLHHLHHSAVENTRPSRAQPITV